MSFEQNGEAWPACWVSAAGQSYAPVSGSHPPNPQLQQVITDYNSLRKQTYRRLPSKELRERLCIDDLALVLQQNRLQWYGCVL